jgi:hypothetical protein
MSSRSSVLKLYKDILGAAKKFPSIKRKGIIAEIKLEFRENAGLTDPQEIEKRVSLAIKGYGQLAMYAGLSYKRGEDWVVDLEKAPMPKPAGAK